MTTIGRANRLAGVLLALLGVGLAAGLAGCSGGPGGSGAGATSAGDAAEAAAPAAAGGSVAREGGGPPAPAPDRAAGRVAVETRAVIEKGQIELVGKDLTELRADVQRLLDGFDGYVAEEETSNGDDGDVDHSRLVVRVPSPAFDEAMTAFGDLGRLESTQRQARDVTTEVIDVQARVRAQEKSLRRLENILTEARDLGDVIRLESEIADRQAALDSLKAQQAYLADQTTLATITLYLSAPERVAPAPGTDDAGFLTGLAAGWRAMTTFLAGVATTIGAVLPFAVLLGVLALPVWLAWRGLRARRRTPEATTQG